MYKYYKYYKYYIDINKFHNIYKNIHYEIYIC